MVKRRMRTPRPLLRQEILSLSAINPIKSAVNPISSLRLVPKLCYLMNHVRLNNFGFHFKMLLLMFAQKVKMMNQ